MLRMLKRKVLKDPLTFAIFLLLIFIVLLFYMMPNPSYKDDDDHPAHRSAQEGVAQLNQIDTPDLSAGGGSGGGALSAYPAQLPVYREGQLGNYEVKDPWKPEKPRPADYGHKYNLDTDADDIDQNEVSLKKSEYGMNIIASDHIPMDRIVPDLRHPECKHWDYPEKLPTASVVIVFHNEGFSTLLRTVHSVLIRSPQRFLREVLLVDDFSNKEPLKGKVFILKVFC